MSTPISILLVDDHSLFRRGMAALLTSDPGLAVIGQAGDAGEAVRLARQHRPDVILLDNHLPGATGIQALADLRAAAPEARVLMLTVSEDTADLRAALRNGANGYLIKSMEGDELSAAIRRCRDGQTVISQQMTGKLVDALQGNDANGAANEPLSQLSPREREVLEQIARGASNKEIARTLDIAETTVKIHVQHILRKLGLASRVQAALYLERAGKR